MSRTKDGGGTKMNKPWRDEGIGSYHSLNSLPWGLSLIPLIMKFAR